MACDFLVPLADGELLSEGVAVDFFGEKYFSEYFLELIFFLQKMGPPEKMSPKFENMARQKFKVMKIERGIF